MTKLLIATNNPGKIKEYRKFFKDLPLILVSLRDLKIKKKVKEDGKTFKENAVKKAKFYSKLTGLPALADDSGLEIDYLGGEPGVKSRRWPGYEASDKEMINLALKKLEMAPQKKRGAQMRVVIALVLPQSKVYTFEGLIRGVILKKPLKKIIPGFPFRSLFYVSSKKGMLGEKESHRKIAAKKARPTLIKHIT